MEEQELNRFREALQGKKIPLLVLDHKWHHLFKGTEKTPEIIEYEKQVNDCLLRQSSINLEIKDLKKLKTTLMQNIVDNMDEADAEKKSQNQSKKMEENKRLIQEVNDKIDAAEDELLDLPKIMQDANANLMILSMAFCYEKLHNNAETAKEIGDWITNIRIELKKNIIRKQYCEVKNKEMFSYMNDILGAKVLDIFDIQYEDDFELKQPEDAVKLVSKDASKKDAKETQDFKSK